MSYLAFHLLVIKILEKDSTDQNVTGETLHFQEEERDAASIFALTVIFLLTIEKMHSM